MTHHVAETHGNSIATGADTSVLQLAAVTRSVRVTEWAISFDGVTASDVPVQVMVMRQTTVGTGSAVTPAKRLTYASAPTTTVLDTVTAEGTADEILESHFVTPNGGLLYMSYPQDSEIIMVAGEFLAVVVNVPTSAVKVSCWVGWEEV